MSSDKVVYVDFRKKCRVDALPDDPVLYVNINCRTCPEEIKRQCFWLVKIFKRRLCPFS